MAVNQVLVGSIAICLTAIAIAGVLSEGLPAVIGVGWAPLAIGAGYVSGMRLLHQNRSEPPFAAFPEPVAHDEIPSLGRALIGFLLGVAVILFAARYLAESAADLSAQLGVSSGFVGVLMLALTTSLPEVSVTVTSLKSGSYDLAVGNLLGSNCFNMVILLFLDISDGRKSLLANVEPGVLLAACFAILLTGLTLIEVLNKAERRTWKIEPAALLRVVVYGLGLLVVYTSS